MSSTARGPHNSHPYIFGKKNINFSPSPASSQGVQGDVHSASRDFSSGEDFTIPDDEKVCHYLLSYHTDGFRNMRRYYLSDTDLDIDEEIFDTVVFDERKDDVESLVLYCNDESYPMVRYDSQGSIEVDFSAVKDFSLGYGGQELDEMIENSQCFKDSSHRRERLNQLTNPQCLSYERIRQGFTQRAELRKMVFYGHDFDMLATQDYSSPAFKKVMSSLANSDDFYWDVVDDTVVLPWDQVDKWLDSQGFNELVSAWDLGM